MLGENKSNAPLPVFVNQNLFDYPGYSANQLQLFGINDVNYFGTETNPTLCHHKGGREAEVIPSQQKLQISLNNKIYHDEVHQAASVHNQNPVSTGLKLSYDDEERNSSVTSASGSMTAASSILLAASDNLRTELERQKDEVDQYLKTQEENLIKGVRDMKRRQMASFLNAIEITLGKKLHEKDIELENINRKSRELSERMKQVATEAQQWFYRAKYNESVVNILKANIQEAMKGVSGQGKEGYGDNDIDDAASCIDPNNYLSSQNVCMKSTSGRGNMICRTCKVKEVSILLMPCRHLCLCKDCEGMVNVCPVCQMIPSYTLQVYLS